MIHQQIFNYPLIQLVDVITIRLSRLLPLHPMIDEQNIEPEEASEELYEKQVIRTDKGQEPYRIDKFLMNRIEGATRNKIQQAIEAGMVTVDGKPVKTNFK